MLQVEWTRCFCDLNHTEYVDKNIKEPNMVFYWGLKDVKNDFNDIDFVKNEFRKIIFGNSYGDSFGKMELSILLAL
jgi:hypothetical protein